MKLYYYQASRTSTGIKVLLKNPIITFEEARLMEKALSVTPFAGANPQLPSTQSGLNQQIYTLYSSWSSRNKEFIYWGFVAAINKNIAQMMLDNIFPNTYNND